MKRRTLLKSFGLGLCTAMLGLWPDFSQLDGEGRRMWGNTPREMIHLAASP